MKKFLKVALIGGVIMIIALYLILLSLFTADYPPIKEYKFEVTVPSLERKILDLVKDDGKYDYVLTDTTGSEDTGYDYQVELGIKVQGKNYKYLLRYFEQTGLWEKASTSRIELIGAYNMTDNFGGSKMEDKRMINIVRIFDEEFIDKLE